jgi:beta-galactosidase
VQGLAADAKYVLRAAITNKGAKVVELTSKPFQGSDLKDGRIAVTEKWKAEKLWDTITPQNQFDVALSLLDEGSKVLDTALPVRFGYREFWIDGKDFYLNGTRIYFSCIPLNNGNGGSAQATYEAAKETMLRYMSTGINFVYTHNYSCAPGSHSSFNEILRAADDVGMLVSFSQPHFGEYRELWKLPPENDPKSAYARHAEFYVRVAQNHPSVVFYSTSHNGTGYAEDMNPVMIDGIANPRNHRAQETADQARRAGSGHLRGGQGDHAAVPEHGHQFRLHTQLQLLAGEPFELQRDSAGRRRRGDAHLVLSAALRRV